MHGRTAHRGYWDEDASLVTAVAAIAAAANVMDRMGIDIGREKDGDRCMTLYLGRTDVLVTSSWTDSCKEMEEGELKVLHTCFLAV